MGSGKSTVAKNLARLKRWEYLDLDAFVEMEEGRSISEIFEQDGEAAFRIIESEKLRSLDTSLDMVVACGGGTPCFYDNIDWMNKNGYTIYLQLSAAALKSRLSGAKTIRPLISNLKSSELEAYIVDSLSKREVYYLQAKEYINGLNVDITQLSDHLESVGPYNP